MILGGDKMGMYTGIRFKGYIKPEYRSTFEPIAMRGDWVNSKDTTFSEFGMLRRARHIPCGPLEYMPSEWEVKSSDEKHSFPISRATEGFERTWDEVSGYWVFQTSLKNYEGEIESWLNILPYFIEEICHLEIYYELWEYSQRYTLICNEVILQDEKYRRYIYR